MRLPVWVRTTLPRGQTLPVSAWRSRHRALLVLLGAHAVGLPIFAVQQGYGVPHSLVEGSIVGAFVGAALLARAHRRIAALAVATGLITCSALLVHIWGGVIEGHFHFFVMVALLALYEDWLAFLAAAAYVVLHHGITGIVSPASVYNHQDAVENPWKWALIHGVFVVGAGGASVITWRLNEAVRARTRESDARFRSAFQNAPIGMVLSSLSPGDRGHFLQVNGALCDMLNRPESELLGATFVDVVHPDDLDALTRRLDALVQGDEERVLVEPRYVRGDGTTVWGLTAVSLVRDARGRPLHKVAHIQDVTLQREAHERLEHQAYEDPLTGLFNRRKLMENIEHALVATEPMVLVLFDLDGFKMYNDTFGHSAGDALLTRLGRHLEHAVAGKGTAYRMGGDEFCVLTRVDGGDSDALLAEARAALSEQGDAFEITASYGSVIFPEETGAAEEVLRLADQRMYAQKNSSRGSAAMQAANALAAALGERSPELIAHQRDVTHLCRAVASELDVPADDLGPLLQAAQLHDIGKIAVPDTILEKPGPLDDDEWVFMWAHTLIGERILAAAPALARAARIVRSSHERYGGGGYPDGLVGDDIPLGSRIIAVCDAFDAMTSDRPYRKALTEAAAMAELERNSGTQFDPTVVSAFVKALTEREAAAA